MIKNLDLAGGLEMKGREEGIEFLPRFLEFCYIPSLDNLSWIEKSLIMEPTSPWTMARFEKRFGHFPVNFEEERRAILETLDWIFEMMQGDCNFQVIVPHFFLKVGQTFSFKTETFFGGDFIKLNVYRPGTYAPDEPIETRSVHLVFAKFFESLDGFPATSLSRCPQCKKIFFNPTKRRKRYCSLSCQSRAGVERFREKKQPGDGN